MKRKLLAGLPAMSMTVMMLTGCSSGGGGSTPSDSASETGDSAAAEDETADTAQEAPAGDGNYTIGVSIYYYSEFITLMCEGIEEKADEPGVDVVILDANNDSVNQITQLENLIAHNDEMALGAIQAIEAAGKMDEITVTGVDAIKDGCNAVKEGTLLGTVYQDAKLEGGNGLQLCYDILTSNEPDQKFNLIDMTLITQDNVDTLLTTLYAD